MKISDAYFHFETGDPSEGSHVVRFCFLRGKLKEIHVCLAGQRTQKFKPIYVNRTPRACAGHALDAIKISQGKRPPCVVRRAR